MSSDLSSDLTSDLSVIVSIPATQDPRSKISRKLFLEILGQDPRSKISRKLFLDALAESWMHPRSKIQDSQKIFLGCRLEILDAPKIQDPRFPENFSWMHLQNLGCTKDLGSWVYPKISKISKKGFLEILDLGSWVHPRFPACIQEKISGNLGSWILGASKISSLHPRKIVWESWILDLGCIQDSCKCIQEKFSGNLGSWILGLSQDFQEKLSGNLGSWVAGIETMTLKSEVKSELKSELMSQETQYSVV